MRGQHDRPAVPGPVDDAGENDSGLPGHPAGEMAAPDRASPPDRLDHRAAASVQEQLAARLSRLPPGHPSSPYNGDGSLRPPVPDYRKMERPLPGEDGYEEPWHPPPEPAAAAAWERPAGTGHGERGRPRAIDSRPEADQEADSWRNSLQHLQDLWQQHEKKWPESERPPAGKTGDEPGSWRGPSGHYLNLEENLVAGHALERVGEVEKKTTPALAGIADKMPGTELAGLEFRLKGEDRFKEKIAEELRAKPERSIDEIAERMPDALRYTCQMDTSLYADNYWRGRQMLQQRGNELLLSRNSWGDKEYKGINTRWLSPQGQVFEVQFHTKESYEAKQLTHEAYERLRSKTTNGAERPFLEAFQKEVSSHIPIPPGVEHIQDYRKKGY